VFYLLVAVAGLLAEALKANTSLLELELGSNGAGAEGAVLLADALKHNSALERLDLSANGVGIGGAVLLAEAFKVNFTLTALELGANGVGAKGARMLAEVLKAGSALRRLGLRCNELGDGGCRSICAALECNKTLRELSLAGNGIGAEGAACAAEMLRGGNRSLALLDLRRNPGVGAAGGTALLGALAENRGLTSLDLAGCALGDATRRVAAALGANSTLCVFNGVCFR
jgi:NLR family CARD domain-containing protein 3